MAAGFVDFEITWKADVFSGAPQSSSAASFGTLGINFRARRAADEEEWNAALIALSCELPTQPSETPAEEARAPMPRGARSVKSPRAVAPADDTEEMET